MCSIIKGLGESKRNEINNGKVRVRIWLLGSIVPSGIQIKKISEKENVMRDSTSKRKHSHSIAAEA